MDNSGALRTYFRTQVFNLRKSQKWTQSRVAELLQANGFSAAHPSTVAKIEAGTRDVTLHELTAFAAVFGVSTDELLGQAEDRRQPLHRVLRRLTQTVEMGRLQTESVEQDLRKATIELASIDGVRPELIAQAEAAADALLAATKALTGVGAGWGGGEVGKAIEAMYGKALRDETEEEKSK